MKKILFILSILIAIHCGCSNSDKILSKELVEKTDQIILSKRIGDKFYAVKSLEKEDLKTIIDCVNVKFKKGYQNKFRGDYKLDLLNSDRKIASLKINYSKERPYVNFSSDSENYGYQLNYELSRYIDETISETSLIANETIREKALKHQGSNEWIKLDSISVEEFVNLLAIQNYTSNTTYILTTTGNTNKDWIREDDFKYLMNYIDSDQPSHCVMQMISSDLPIGKTSTIGGQIQNLILSYMNNEQYPNGLTICESSNQERIELIEEWIKNKDK